MAHLDTAVEKVGGEMVVMESLGELIIIGVPRSQWIIMGEITDLLQPEKHMQMLNGTAEELDLSWCQLTQQVKTDTFKRKEGKWEATVGGLVGEDHMEIHGAGGQVKNLGLQPIRVTKCSETGIEENQTIGLDVKIAWKFIPLMEIIMESGMIMTATKECVLFVKLKVTDVEFAALNKGLLLFQP